MATTRTCTVSGCGRDYHGYGYCSLHLARFHAHGTPTGGRARIGATADFVTMAATYEGNDCLLWPYGQSHGYGQVSNPKKALAHTLVCELAHGARPPDKTDAAHSCGVPLCCNPRHLRWATRKENHADMIRHDTRRRGVNHGGAKLSPEQVQAIRSAVGRTQKAIAAEHGISQQTVSNIKTGKIWSLLKNGEKS